MMKCPKCKKNLLSPAGWKPGRGDIDRCGGCGFTQSDEDFENGLICAGCGDKVDKSESFCERCAEKLSQQEIS
jgi:hypothetical protein